jgi:glucose-1-phosphate adenylyltransferase
MVRGAARVFAYPFEGYWVDVGTVEAYWKTQMDLLDSPPPLDLNDRSWVVHTRSEERPPVLLREGSTVRDSMITDGCTLAPGARVERSILSPGVTVGTGALVRESVVLTDSVIEAGARVERAVIDKSVRIGRNARVGQMGRTGEDLGITTVGKNARIPDRAVVPRGALVDSDSSPQFFEEETAAEEPEEAAQKPRA